MRPDLRLVPPACACWVTALVLVGWTDAAPAVGLVSGLLAVGALVAASRLGRPTVASAFASAALGCAAAALVAASVAFAAPVRHPHDLVDAAAGHVEVTAEAVVSSIPTADPAGGFSAHSIGRIRFEAQLVRVDVEGGASVSAQSPALVFAEVGDGAPTIGSTVRIRGTLQATAPGESVAFLFFAAEPVALTGEPPWYLTWANPLRAGFSRAASGLAGDGGALLPGLAIGDTSAVSESLDAAMKHSALSHLTAVSGANCAVVIAIVMLVGAAAGVPRAVRIGVAVIALAGFVVLVTPQPSVLRAAVMATIILASLGFGRAGRGVPALALAVVVLIALDPWLARSYGFALSVSATAGLLLLAGPVARMLARWLPYPLALACAVPLAAQIACQPILVLLDPAIPLSGVVANLLAEPAAPIATVLGLLGCLLLPVLPAVGTLCLQLAWVPSAWIAQIARSVDALPVGRLPWVGGMLGAALVAAVAAAALWLAVRPRGTGRTRTVLATVGLLLTTGAYGGALLGASVARAVAIPPDWQIAACDVGQGDAVVVRDGEHYGLVDVGPDPAPLSECLDALGIGRLELLVLTHYDLDHVGGVAAVVGRVDTAIVGTPVTAADARILADLQGNGATLRRGVAGDTGRLGALEWRILWPLRGAATEMATGNAGSVTVAFDGAGLRSAFLGDLGEESQDAMLAAVDPGRVDVVKVAHHGSADQSAELYRRLGATFGIVSVGVDNGYGHPTGRLLDLLAGVGTAVGRTDLQGMIIIGPDASGGVRVWTERAAGPAVGVGRPG